MAQSYHADGGASSRTYTFSQKWGDDPFTAMGYTQAPNALIDYAARLGLTPQECWLIVCVLKFKHTPDNPFPSQETLAALFGQSERTIRRLVEKIEQRGLLTIERVRGDHGHYTHIVYDFTPLRVALNACYWEGHPQERPATPRSRPRTTGRSCPPSRSLKKRNEKGSSLPAVWGEKSGDKTEAERPRSRRPERKAAERHNGNAQPRPQEAETRKASRSRHKRGQCGVG